MFVSKERSLEVTLREAETALTDPEVRASEAALEELLHSEFTETSSTGEVYDRRTMIEMMTSETPGRVVIRDFHVDPVTDDVAVVSYRSVGTSGQEVRRTSLWVRSEDRWQLRHHQGTRVPDRWSQVS